MERFIVSTRPYLPPQLVRSTLAPVAGAMGRAEVAAVLATHAQGQDVVSFEWISERGCSTAQVARGVGSEDALAFLTVATGVRVGSLAVGVSAVLSTAGAAFYGWTVTE